jgi:hypothetical protein
MLHLANCINCKSPNEYQDVSVKVPQKDEDLGVKGLKSINHDVKDIVEIQQQSALSHRGEPPESMQKLNPPQVRRDPVVKNPDENILEGLLETMQVEGANPIA